MNSFSCSESLRNITDYLEPIMPQSIAFIDAIHVFSHGASGELQLGDSNAHPRQSQPLRQPIRTDRPELDELGRLFSLWTAILALALFVVTFDAKAATITVGSSATTCALASNQYSNSGADCAVLASALQTGLSSNAVTITSTGDISIESALSWSQNGLTLTAANNINVNAVMAASGAGALTMSASASWDKGILMGWNSDLTFKGKINYTSTGLLTINNAVYTVITTLGAQGSVTQTDLQGMKGNLAGKYALGGDIAIGAADDTWNSGAGFSPVGDSASIFTGRFYGLGHTISGLSVTPGSTTSNGAGLFGHSTGEIHGIGLTNVNILAKGNTGSGGLTGQNGGIISNSYTTGTVRTNDPDYSGGTGGLVGANSTSGSGAKIFGSYSAANVSTRNDHATTLLIYAALGGLVGVANNGEIKESFATGNVGGSGKAGTAKMMGGLIGELRAVSIIVSNVYATGSVTSDAGGATTMKATATQGEIPTGSVAYAPYVGGLVGLMNKGAASNGYATGAVSGISGDSNMGGFLGKITGTGTVSNSFWNTTTSGQSSIGVGGGSSSSGVTGKTTTEMQSASTYTSASYSSSYWGLKSGTNNNFAVLRAFYPEASFPNAAPTATLTSAPDVTTVGGTTYTVRMTYTDTDGSISAASIGSNNIAIAGLSYSSFSIISGSGTATTAVDYVFTPPGGSWNGADNSTYTIALGSSPATDNQSAAVTALTAGGSDTSITVNIVQANTTTTLGSSANPSTYGNSVNFTANVSPSAATGTVNFKDNGTSITGCASQPLSSGVATCAISTLSVGNHPITADYSGDSDYLTSTGTLTGGQTVNQISYAPTVTAISPTNGSTLGGTAVTITGTNLTGASAVSIGGTACAAINLVSATSITCTTPALAAGIASVLVTTSGGTNAANTLFTYITPNFIARLNDSGATQCTDAGATLLACSAANTGNNTAYPRQDARFGRDAAQAEGKLLPAKTGGGAAGFDFTPLDATGNTIALDGPPSTHACVHDNVTNLTWEVKTSSGLRSNAHTYTWYNGRTGTLGTDTCGATLAASSNQCNTNNYVQAVNAASPCGAGSNPWRVPTRRELLSIVHHGANTPAIDPDYFPSTNSIAFWTSDVYAFDPTFSAWYVEFNIGETRFIAQSGSYPVRLVRSGQ
jgi:hypothetical protein